MKEVFLMHTIYAYVSTTQDTCMATNIDILNTFLVSYGPDYFSHTIEIIELFPPLQIKWSIFLLQFSL